MNRSFRAPERGQTGNLRARDNRDEDLALFREMRRREKERSNLLLLQNSDELDASHGPTGNSAIFNIPSSTPAPARKNGADDFLNSDNDKNDYEWLLTPPGTPLFPSLEMEHHKTVMNQHGTPKARPTDLKSRLSNSKPESASRSNSSSSSRQLPSSSSGLNTSIRRPSSSGGSRPSTPNSRPTITSSSSRTTSTSTSNRSTISAPAKPSSKLTPTSNSRPSRSSTPTSRPNLSLSKSTIVPPSRPSTPTTRSTTRSSTPSRAPGPTGPASKPASRAPTPSRRPTNGTTTPALKSPTLSSSAARNPAPAPARPSSPSLRPKMWKPSEMPGFSLDAPPNLRTSVNDRPPSATRGRPGAPSSRSSSVEPASNGRGRRQSCSPGRGRPPNGVMHSSGSSVPVPSSARLHAKANDNVSPGLVGTKMVERTVNMRKLVPPKQDGKHSPRNFSGKPALSSPDASGFGRNLSKKSLDMAIRHMDIRRTIPGNLRPLMTNIPASSLYSVRSGPTSRRTVSVSDSPLATSSNASSELSVNNNAHYVDGHDVDDDVSSDKGIRSPSSLHLNGR